MKLQFNDIKMDAPPQCGSDGQGLAFIIPVYPSFILISRKWRCLL